MNSQTNTQVIDIQQKRIFQFWEMKLHIGSEIARIQKARGLSNDDFAKQISTSVRNLNNIKLKDDLMIQQLFRISEVLNFNFFELLQPIVVEPSLVKEPQMKYSKDKKKHTIKFEVQYPTELSGELGKFMMHVDGVAEKMGFEVV